MLNDCMGYLWDIYVIREQMKTPVLIHLIFNSGMSWGQGQGGHRCL